MTATTEKSSPIRADAVSFLTADHREVDMLSERYKDMCKAGAAADDREAVAMQICDALTVHAAVEEEIFYPAARAAGIDSALLDEAAVEHEGAKNLITRLRGMAPVDALYDAKVFELVASIDHHVQEEQDKLFPACERAKMDLTALAKKLAARKAQLVSEMNEDVA